MKRVPFFLLGLAVCITVLAADTMLQTPYPKWSLAAAVRLLNSSAWARQETFTRVIGGVGSGISGEKEIYNTFYVRFLSARPIREAYARVQQIQIGYDKWKPQEKKRFDARTKASLDLDVDRWIVVAVSFRSNDPNEESLLRQFFESETASTLRNRAFLSTDSFPQVELVAYFPPKEESVGAKFIFPRRIDDVPIVSGTGGQITFELVNLPGVHTGQNSSASYQEQEDNFSGRIVSLRAIFEVKDMIVGERLVL
jgi:hypothetical protein